MRVLFIGPGGGRWTTAYQPKGYGTGGFIVWEGSRSVWVDPGPGAIVRARALGVDVEHINAIYISHAHLDHMGDINAVAEAVNGLGHKRRAILYAPEELLNCGGLTAYHKGLFKEVKALSHNRDVEGLFVSKEVRHTTSAFGFAGKVAYTSDTAFFDGLSEVRGELLIANPYLLRGNHPFHLSVEQVVKLAILIQPKMVVINHITKPIYGALIDGKLEGWLGKLRREGIEAVVAKEGLELLL